MSLQLYQVSFISSWMSEWQTVEKWSKNCLGKTITFIGFCYTFYSSSSNMWTATTSSSLTFAQLGLDVTHSRSWFLLLCWRASDVVFICLAFFFLNASKLHFSCSFYSRRWIIKATYWISKVCLWKTRLTRTAEVEELLKILVRLWRTFFLILFHFIYAKKNSFIFSFQVLWLRKKRLKLKTKCLVDTILWSFLKCARLSLPN